MLRDAILLLSPNIYSHRFWCGNLAETKKLNELTIGIIGVGNVGSKVAKVARDFGMRVLLNDLPREEKRRNRAVRFTK